MEDFARQFRRPVKPDAIVAFIVGTLVAYFLQVSPIGLGTSRILTTLIVAAVGGLWYKVRDVV